MRDYCPKDFHYEFQTKHVTLHYRVEVDDEGNSYIPVVFYTSELLPVLEFLDSMRCIRRINFDPQRQDDVIIDVYFKYDTADESIKIICRKAIQMIKEITKNKKEGC